MGGGALGDGTVFKITPEGTLTTLYSLGSQSTDGVYPVTALIQATDGNLYGTTSAGGCQLQRYGLQTGSRFFCGPASYQPRRWSGQCERLRKLRRRRTWLAGGDLWLDLATATLGWGSSFVGINAPTSLGGTSVTIGGENAFVAYVSPNQVNVQVPSTVGTGPQPVIVKTGSGTSSPSTITVRPGEPGLLSPTSFNIAGKQYVAAFFSDKVTLARRPERFLACRPAPRNLGTCSHFTSLALAM